jgi:hypothetical protein
MEDVTVNKHFFETTAAAYDACQCDSSLKDGDILIIQSERVVGVVDTWPMAVTVDHGKLHPFYGIPDNISVRNVMAAEKEAEDRCWHVNGVAY